MKRPLFLILVLLIPPGAAVAVREYRDYQRYPRRFAEVVPDAIYRGGYPTAANIRNLHDEKAIRAVINLTDEKNTPEERAMIKAIERLGVRFFRIKMPGDGCGDFTSLDMAADAMANKQNWPLFLHCAAGKQRSNAVTAAYRMKYCGWSFGRALEELQKKYDLDPKSEQKLCEHLQRYAFWVESHRPLPPPKLRAKLPTGTSTRKEESE